MERKPGRRLDGRQIMAATTEINQARRGSGERRQARAVVAVMMMMPASGLVTGAIVAILIVRLAMIGVVVVGIMMVIAVEYHGAEREMLVDCGRTGLMLDTVDSIRRGRTREHKRKRDAEHRANTLERESGRSIHEDRPIEG